MPRILERVYACPRTVARLRAGLLGPHVDGFAGSLIEQGYSRRTIPPKVRLIGKLDQWLRAKRVTLCKLDEQLVAVFLRDLPITRCPRNGDKATLRGLLRHLRQVGVIRPSVVPDDTRNLSRVESGYERYLIHERGLCQASIRFHLYHAHRFVSECFGPRPIRFTMLRQHHITEYILRHAPAYKQRSAQTWISALRGFIRYLHLRGETDTDLSGCVLKTANWNLSALPKYIEGPEVERLLGVVDRHTRTGLRDYAILLLLARLGPE